MRGDCCVAVKFGDGQVKTGQTTSSRYNRDAVAESRRATLQLVILPLTFTPGGRSPATMRATIRYNTRYTPDDAI